MGDVYVAACSRGTTVQSSAVGSFPHYSPSSISSVGGLAIYIGVLALIFPRVKSLLGAISSFGGVSSDLSQRQIHPSLNAFKSISASIP